MGVQVRVEEDKLETTQVAAHNLSAMLMFPKGHGEIDFLCGAVMSSIRDARSWQPMHLGISVAVPFTDTGFFVFICLCLTLHISISLLSVPSLSLSQAHSLLSFPLCLCCVRKPVPGIQCYTLHTLCRRFGCNSHIGQLNAPTSALF